MKKIFLSSVILISSYADYTIHYAKNPYHALLPKKDTLQILFDYKAMNDTLDIFNIKEQELGGNAKNFASIGDMNGGEFEFRYTFLKNMMTDVSIEYDKIDIGDENLKNTNLDGFIRYNLGKSPYSFFNAISLDIGMKANIGEDVTYTNQNTLKNLIQKITKAHKVSVTKHKVFVQKDKNSPPYFVVTKDEVFGKIKDLSDNSFYIRLLTEKSISDSKYFSTFLTYQYTNISTTLSTNKELLRAAKNHGKDIQTDLDRSENSINFGMNYMQEFSSINIVTEIGYEFDYVFRDSDLDARNYNNILTVDLSYPVNKKFFITTGGKIMFSQFNNIIPYLYNKYSQTTFDHKYGYAYLGIGYRF